MGLERHHQINHAPVTASAINIPDDLLIAEVLACLPVKSVVRFKCVQKSWLAATKNDWFVCHHLKFSRAMPPDVLIVPRQECSDDEDEEIGLSNEINFYRLHEPLGIDIDDIKVELMLEAVQPEVITHTSLPTHCDGLVAIATTTDQVYISNPATKEFVTLPLGSHDVCEIKSPSAALGFNPRRNRYVIARYFYRNYMVFEDEDTCEQSFEYYIGHKVFTLGLGHSWDITDNPPHAICPFARPICMRGAFYCWQTTCQNQFGHSATTLMSSSRRLVPMVTVLSRDTEMLIALGNEKLYQFYEWSDTMSEVVDMEDLEYERQDGSMLTCGDIGPVLYHVVPFVKSLVSISPPN
uniref:F-box associated beta-propeller type 3 domain-containing protein n=1 Tax=Oryza punctata TaxID=4537 RepID=A0A0E0KPR7_ORYPU